MRLVIVISVLNIALVYCAHIDISDNEQNESLDERIKPELNSERPLIHKSSKKILHSLRKESSLEKQRRRCDSCRETVRCKIYGKCELCTKACKEYEALLLSTTEAPLVGSIHVDNDDAPATELPDQLFTNPNRYYTIGSFGSGPQQNLLVRLLNIVRKDSLDKLIILAKPKGQEEETENLTHPIIIDTANVFKFNITGKEFATQVHTIDGNKVPKSVDLELTSKIDNDLDAEFKRKQKIFGKNSLSPLEIDRIIDRALLMFNYKPISQRSPLLNLRQRDSQLGSKSNFEEMPPITTRRSISRWKLIKSNEETMEDSSENIRQIINKNSKIIDYTSNNQLPNKRTAPSDRFLGKVSRNRKLHTDYKGDSYLAQDECINSEGGNECSSKDRSDSNIEGGNEAIQYETLPPSVKVNEIGDSKTEQVQVSNVQALDSSDQQLAPEILSVPINVNEHLESDSQLLESTPSSNLAPETETSDRNSNENFEETVLSLSPPPGISGGSEEDSNLATANKQMATSESFLGERQASALNEKKLEDTLQISESNLNVINASHFTLILKDLERKVENIADLVKKTCGKESKEKATEEYETETESIAFRNPLSLTKQNLTKGEDLSSVKPTESPIVESRVFITDTPNMQISTSEGIYQTKEFTTTQSWNGLTSIDDAINRLNEDAGYLVDKALDIAQSLQHVKPVQPPDNVLSKSIDDKKVEVGCSKEDSKEYVGKSKKEGESTSTLSQNVETLEARGGFGPTTVLPGLKLEETVVCSKEDSKDCIGKANEHKDIPVEPKVKTQDSKLGNEDVGCSKESDEYIGKAEPKLKELQVSTSNLNSETTSSKPGTKQPFPVKFSETTDEPEKRLLNQKVLNNNNEDVGCSKGESEEYVGEKKGENIEKATEHQEEKVGCSKEKEDYEYVPTYPLYNTYRFANDDPKATKLPHLSVIPTLNDLYSKNLPLLPLSPTSLQKSADTMPSTSDVLLASNLQQPSSTYKSEMDETFTVKTTRGDQALESEVPTKTPNNKNIKIFVDRPKKPAQIDANSLQEQNAPANRDYQPINYYTPANDEMATLPSSEPVHQYTTGMKQPEIIQRFKDDEHPPVGIERGNMELGRMELPNKDDILGERSDLVTNDKIESTAAVEVHTLNPFSIFGRVVPQLNNTELSNHQVPSDSKIYFVGTGMQLPLNMKKHKDGSYQLSVDIERLCNNCNGNKCTKKTDNLVENRVLNNANKEENNQDHDINSGMQPQSTAETQNFNSNQETISENNLSESKGATERYISKRKIGSYSSGNSVFPSKFMGRKHVNRSLSNEMNQQKIHPLLHVPTKDEIKQSEVSKRSPSFHFLFPNLKDNHQENKQSNDFDNYRHIEEDTSAISSSSSLQNVDESLKKIDKNMKKYYDQRYKLENYYKNQNKKDLESPDGGRDLVKRKVSLVNNVLSWMKNIAIQNAHS